MNFKDFIETAEQNNGKVTMEIDISKQPQEQPNVIDSDLYKKIVSNVAESMMAHYENWNVVTDGHEIEPDNFTEQEINLATTIDLNCKKFQQEVLLSLQEQLSNR